MRENLEVRKGHVCNSYGEAEIDGAWLKESFLAALRGGCDTMVRADTNGCAQRTEYAKTVRLYCLGAHLMRQSPIIKAKNEGSISRNLIVTSS
jgi:hypothetical protein